MIKSGWLLDAFTLDTEGGEIQGEIRLVRVPGGAEFLWHYENGRHVRTHPARRCTGCEEVIVSSHIGSRCYECATADGLSF